MSISEFMNKDVVTVNSDENLNTVANLMREKNVGSVLVVDQSDNPTPQSIITDRDIVTRVIGEQVDLNEVSVKDVASAPLVCFKEDQGVQEVLNEMMEKSVRRAPIVDAAKKLVGIISIDDLLLALIEELQCLSGLIKRQMA